MSESAGIAVKAVATVRKYAPGTSIEDIDSGKAVPYETVSSWDLLHPTEQLKELTTRGEGKTNGSN